MDWDKYDYFFYENPDDLFLAENELLDGLLKELDLSNSSCLDFGCGSGFWISKLSAYSQAITGIDISEEAISTCQKKYPKFNFLVLKELNIPFPNQTFDFILCAWVFQEIWENESFKAILLELQRILRKGGNIVVAENIYPNERTLFQNTDYGDLFFEKNMADKLRFFQNNTLISIMERIDLKRVKSLQVGYSYFEIYRK